MATIVISSPSTVTRTPVRTGLASSREAARATRLMVSRSGAAGSSDRVALRLREAREVVGGQRAEVEARGAGAELDVALGLAQRQGHRAVGERPGDLDEQPARAGPPSRRPRSRPRDRPRARAPCPWRAGGPPPLVRDQDPGESLQRGAGGDRPGDDEQRIEKRLPCGVDLHGWLVWASLGVVRVVDGVDMWTASSCDSFNRFGHDPVRLRIGARVVSSSSGSGDGSRPRGRCARPCGWRA